MNSSSLKRVNLLLSLPDDVLLYIMKILALSHSSPNPLTSFSLSHPHFQFLSKVLLRHVGLHSRQLELKQRDDLALCTQCNKLNTTLHRTLRVFHHSYIDNLDLSNECEHMAHTILANAIRSIPKLRCLTVREQNYFSYSVSPAQQFEDYDLNNHEHNNNEITVLGKAHMLVKAFRQFRFLGSLTIYGPSTKSIGNLKVASVCLKKIELNDVFDHTLPTLTTYLKSYTHSLQEIRISRADSISDAMCSINCRLGDSEHKINTPSFVSNCALLLMQSTQVSFSAITLWLDLPEQNEQKSLSKSSVLNASLFIPKHTGKSTITALMSTSDNPSTISIQWHSI